MDLTTNRRESDNDIEEARPLTVGPDPSTASAGPYTAYPAPTEQVERIEPVEHRVVEPAEHHVVEVERTHTARWEPAAIIAGVAAIGALVVGGVTVARAGLDRPFRTPVVDVGSFTATALLGFVELGIGVALLIAALGRWPSAIRLVSIAGLVAALVAVFEPTLADNRFAIERNFAIIAAVAMGVVLLASFLPSVERNSRRVERT